MLEITIPWPEERYNLAKDREVIRYFRKHRFTDAPNVVLSVSPLHMIVPLATGGIQLSRLPNGHLSFVANCVELPETAAHLLQKAMWEQTVALDLALPWASRKDGSVLFVVSATLPDTKVRESLLDHVINEIQGTVEFVGHCLKEAGILRGQREPQGGPAPAWVAEQAKKEAEGPRRDEFVLEDKPKSREEPNDDHHG